MKSNKPNKNKILVIGTISFVLCAVLAIFIFIDKSGKKQPVNFSDSYQEYELVAQTQELAVYSVGMESNPVRQKLNQILGRVLTEEMSPSIRLGLANEGLILIKEFELQIDKIGEQKVLVEGAVGSLENSAKEISKNKSKESAIEMISKIKERTEIASDIRGLSYGANDHTRKIFKRIIDDKGDLTNSHITALNSQISEVEEDFDRRSSLYEEFSSLGNQIEKNYNDIEGML